ncbi:feruloyl-CoA synthase [Pigmentiphaga litoralis]|uniref:feruloyl-CoA synthase n=1 Tax=Pigmentiphaga litoralis TaxID=516702 RepID=UPI0019AEEB21|nr:feruloyl-CoA synthase [Pigmentiphaga litoralis]GGX07774.1 feruloyl-CoA synthase [Pigmentiphaga litoralis]
MTPTLPSMPPARAFRPIHFGPYAAEVTQRSDGAWLLRATDPLQPSPARVTELLVRWAQRTPTATFLARRDAAGQWQHLSYCDALTRVRQLSEALLQRGLSEDRPLLILSGNDIEHALLGLAAMHVGLPYVPLSPAYSLLATDGAKVRHAVELLTPGMVFASDGSAFARAIMAAVPGDVEVVLVKGEIPGRTHTTFADLQATTATARVESAHAAVTASTIAKFLFTSGSTRMPKAVINTHGMICSNLQMYTQCYPFMGEDRPVLVDWLPWHHTAGGNHNFGLVLYHGGSLFIDEGKPTDDGFAETLRNLREISPTVYYSVPKGMDLLTRAMRDDAALRASFFARLRLIFPAGAALSRAVQLAIDDHAVAACGYRIPMTMGLGMTETAPFAISAHLPDWVAGKIGLPAPGVTVKLVAHGDKLEVRYKGPNVTPGYWRQPDLTADAFDSEGFFCSGDAARFENPANPEQGLVFDGRIAEDFKLSSGTWVNVGDVRASLVAAGAPHLMDAVITGQDRHELGALLFLHGPSHAQLTAAGNEAGLAAWVQGVLDACAARAHGSSFRVCRAMVMMQPPSLASGEMTDKGSINQRMVLARRADLVERLYQDPSDAGVVRPTARVSPLGSGVSA